MRTERDRFRQLVEHDGWANAATLVSLRENPAPERARRLMAHLVATERLWLARLRQEPSSLPVWPALDLEECAAELTELQAEWARYLDEVSDEELEDGVAYRNTRGEFWTSNTRDILTHVVLHASYHRGQIAAAVREAGGTPAYTDFIHAVRSGFVE